MTAFPAPHPARALSRRRWLLAASSTSAACWLAACGQSPTRPPERRTVPWARVGVLPVKEHITTGDGVAFVKANTRLGQTHVFIPLSPSGVVASVLATTASVLSQSQRVSFADQVASVGFDAQSSFNQQLLPAFEAAGVRVQAIADPAVDAAIRSDNLQAIPKALDAVLDVQITAAGYYPSSGAGGYSPMLYVVARLLPSSAAWADVERFGYDADYRPAEGERRFYTTPADISVANGAALASKAGQVRTAMETISKHIVAQIVVDTDRRMRNLPRLA